MVCTFKHNLLGELLKCTAYFCINGQMATVFMQQHINGVR